MAGTYHCCGECHMMWEDHVNGQCPVSERDRLFAQLVESEARLNDERRRLQMYRVLLENHPGGGMSKTIKQRMEAECSRLLTKRT